MALKSTLVLGFHEDNEYNGEFNAYLNKEFLNKFEIDIYYTYIEEDFNKVHFIYGIPINLSQFIDKNYKSEQAKINKFIKYMKDKYNMNYRSPFVTDAISWYNTNKKLKNKVEFDIDYTYDPFNGMGIKRYGLSGTMYMKADSYKDSNIVEDIFKLEAFNYGYTYEWFQLDTDSCPNSYWMMIEINTVGDKVEEWFDKIKEKTKNYVWYKDAKLTLLD